MTDNQGGRESPRYAVDCELSVSRPSGTITGRCKNLSMGGLCSELPEALEADAEVDVDIRLIFSSDSLSEALTLPCRVVWVTNLENHIQVGMQFRFMDEEKRNHLAMFLRFLKGSGPS